MSPIVTPIIAGLFQVIFPPTEIPDRPVVEKPVVKQEVFVDCFFYDNDTKYKCVPPKRVQPK